MIEQGQVPAWIALFIGIYALSAGIGGLVRPHLFATMLQDFERSPALNYVTGFVVLALGAIIYLVNPWQPDDWLAVGVTVIGGLMVLEGAFLIAVGDGFARFARQLLGQAGRAWAVASLVIGAALIVIGFVRV
ncbi:hypothetical protein [Porphyrobacter sp. GA68]|uniref:hypothetical protein n=1 Tax=Porphyrobacter sp. GA68 TaxID=2883480 RepID=UPI001D1859D4|nr:hypothetical protein [Porphyrobacter sp. GA68]